MKPVTVNRNEAVILGMLHALGRSGCIRTKLVKLVYLADNFAFEQRGRKLTDFDYVWDHHGPNAVDDGIVQTLAGLAKRGLVACAEFQTQYETYGTKYSVPVSRWQPAPADLALAPQDWAAIERIAATYGRKSWQSVVQASKESHPVREARQYSVLKFSHNPLLEKKRASLWDRHGALLEESFGAAARDEPGTPLEKLRAKYA